MKKCPFCAEEIQDEAKVCKHCRRELEPGAVSVSAPAAAAKKTGCVTWAVAIFIGIAAMGWCSSVMNPTPPAATSTSRGSARSTAPPKPAAPETPVLEILSKAGRPTASGSYYEVEGQVKNLSGRSLDNIQVVATWYTKDGTFITSDSAMIDYNPLLPGQTSPFKTITRGNPEMAQFSVEFKPLFGTALRTKDSAR